MSVPNSGSRRRAADGLIARKPVVVRKVWALVKKQGSESGTGNYC